MPDYKFTGDTPRLMTGLVQGRNATVSDGDWFTPDGSTIICGPGAILHTDEPYTHAELAEVGDNYTPTFDNSTEIPPGVSVITNDTGIAETLMTSEGAPAPVTEQEPTE